MVILFVALLFLFVSITTILYFIFTSAEQVREYKQSIKQLSSYEIKAVSSDLTKPFYERVVVPFVNKWARLLSGVSPTRVNRYYSKKLESAGIPLNLDGERFVALKLIITLVFTVLGIAVSLVFFFTFERLLVTVLVLAVLGYFIPDFWLNNVIERRKNEIKRDLPDTLDLLVICIEAGLGFDSALNKIIKFTKGPLSKELSIVLYEIQVGLTRKEAFDNLSKRTAVPELKAFSNAITQAEILGISIGNVLRSQAEELRTKRKLFAEERAQKIGVKLTFPLVLFIFPAIFVVIIGPAAIRLFMTLIGNG